MMERINPPKESTVPNVLTTRPAESAGVAAALALLVARLLGVVDETEVVMALATVIGFVPSVVTGIVEYRRKQASEAGQVSISLLFAVAAVVCGVVLVFVDTVDVAVVAGIGIICAALAAVVNA